ncbi:FAD-dependent oxidoreductase [Ktedonosporobacter rubrisoli]|uniref:FAD-dependent oxidoreductase n=1 Tax=Ktedonosporobacter rubrisoli TaxID=2509675 RepID=A0A4P6JQY6_KTERU|nr:FAD-dependent monooxygenase [Ktedonosporobacter rubrisoli]QBD77582.1 FAD-dependent oxidoreductase [Ktedonosporobacter rubrisoli]
MQKDLSINNKHILISGASIAGPALACCLRRYGFQPTVVERTKQLREGGYKVDIRGAAVEVARRMGIIDDIRRKSTNMRSATYVTSDNKPIVTMPADFMNGRVDGEDEIMRGDLACILYEQTRQEVEYLFGDSITSLVQNDDGVKVTFERGEPRTFDLVIGADGLHSNVRRLSLGDDSSFIHHLGGYISIFTIPNFLHLDHQELYYSTPGKLVSIYSTGKNTRATCLFFFTSPPLPYDYRDSMQQKKLLANRFAGDGWHIPRLLQFMGDAPDFYFDSTSMIQMDHWSAGRVALLGDAAYCASPASGQGTGLALVGAYVLAGELHAAAGDYQQAFARYESVMREYVKVNQEFATVAVKYFTPQTQIQLWFRNLMLRVLPYVPWKNLITGKIMQDLQRAVNAITLPDYERECTETNQSV